MEQINITLATSFPVDNAVRQAILRCVPGAVIHYVPAETQEQVDALDGSATDVLLTDELPPSDLRRWPKLRFIQVLSAGVEYLKPEHAVWASGVPLCNASGIHAVPMAQWAIGTLLTLGHRIPSLPFQRTRQWPRDRANINPVIFHGKTAAILGYGSIGRECARLARSLGMRVTAVKRDPSRQRDEGFIAFADTGDPEGHLPEVWFPIEELDQVLAECDALFVTCPRTAETRGLIGGKRLALMKPTAFVLVISRGGIVEEKPLAQALHDGKLAGAAVDCFLPEPPPSDHPYFDAPNLILTPHISGLTEDYWQLSQRLFCENLRRCLKDEPLLNISSGKLGY